MALRRGIYEPVLSFLLSRQQKQQEGQQKKIDDDDGKNENKAYSRRHDGGGNVSMARNIAAICTFIGSGIIHEYALYIRSYRPS